MMRGFTHESMRIVFVISIIFGVAVLVYEKLKKKKQETESDWNESDVSSKEGIILISLSIIALVFSLITTCIPSQNDVAEEPPKTTEINGYIYYLYEKDEKNYDE